MDNISINNNTNNNNVRHEVATNNGAQGIEVDANQQNIVVVKNANDLPANQQNIGDRQLEQREAAQQPNQPAINDPVAQLTVEPVSDAESIVAELVTRFNGDITLKKDVTYGGYDLSITNKDIKDERLQEIFKALMPIRSKFTSFNAKGCKKITKLDVLSKFINLRKVDIGECINLEYIDGGNWEKLQGFNAYCCTNLKHIYGTLQWKNVQKVHIGWCTKLEYICGVSWKNLQEFNANWCTHLGHIDGTSQWKKVQKVNVSKCKKLGYICGIKEWKDLQEFNVSGCKNLNEKIKAQAQERSADANVDVNAIIEQFKEDVDCTSDGNDGYKLSIKDKNISDERMQTVFEAFQDVNVTKLELHYCFRITDNGLINIEKLQHLKKLSIKWCNNVADKWLEKISEIKTLKKIELEGCSKITDNGLTNFEKLPRLETLALSACNNITDEQLEKISEIKTLKKIKLKDLRNITSKVFEIVSKSPNIKRVCFHRLDCFSDETLYYATTNYQWNGRVNLLKNVEELSFKNCRSINGSCCSFIGNLQHLKKFCLSKCDCISDEGFETIGKIETMEKLKLDSCRNLTDKGLNAAANKMKNMKVLDLNNCYNITTKGFAAIDKMQNLEFLKFDVWPDEKTDSTEICLLNLTKLKHLSCKCYGGNVIIKINPNCPFAKTQEAKDSPMIKIVEQ